MAEGTPVCDFGWKAPPFTLPGVDGKTHSLDELQGPKGTLVMFICNHCPYVKAVIDRIVRDVKELRGLGVNAVAISLQRRRRIHPDNSFDNMKRFAAEHVFTFPISTTRARTSPAPMTRSARPTFLASTASSSCNIAAGSTKAAKRPRRPDVRRDLFEAMKQIAETGQGPREQIASIGCSIKWKAA